jgi:tRNA (mo5U34)-methyltransferase
MAIQQADVDAHRWIHSIEMGGGIVSKGAKPHALLKAQAEIVFKHGVSGKSVLDIGAWDGGFSFAAEERGARDVLATDYFCWEGPGWGKKAAFELARRARNSRVRDKTVDVFDLDRNDVGTFDVVLFLGVFYHLKHPFLALEKIAPLAKELLILDTETILDTMPDPLMRFFPGAQLAKDNTNWWAPNSACVKAMLSVVGFKRVEMTANPSHDVPINDRRGRYFFHAFRK